MSDARIEPIATPKCIAPSCDRNATHTVFEGPNYCGNFCEPHAAEKVKTLAEYAERATGIYELREDEER